MLKTIFSLLIFLMVTISIIVIASMNTDRKENLAALALVESVKDGRNLTEIAFYSYPVTCHHEDIEKPEAIPQDMWIDFLAANDIGNKPLRLTLLEGQANLMKWEDNLQVYNTKRASLKFRESSKRLITLSRAGFNKEKTRALFCVQHQYGGVFFLVNYENSKWIYSSHTNAYVH